MLFWEFLGLSVFLVAMLLILWGLFVFDSHSRYQELFFIIGGLRTLEMPRAGRRSPG
jgi:hypothetical protein